MALSFPARHDSRAQRETLRDERATVEHLAARRAARQASAVIAVIQDGLIAVDEKGRIADVNDALCLMTGYERRHLVGRRRCPIWSPDDAAAFKAAAVAATCEDTGSSTATATVQLTRRDGLRFPARMVIAPMRGPAGGVMGYVATLRALECDDGVNSEPAEHLLAPHAIRDDALLKVTHALFADEPPESILDRIAVQVARVTGCDVCAIYRLENTRLDLRGSWVSTRLSADTLQTVSEAVLAAGIQGGGVEWHADSAGDANSCVSSIVAHPIRTGTGVWGAIAVGGTGASGAVPARARTELPAFVTTTGLAIACIDARVVPKLDDSRDRLTRLPNRRAFDHHLEREVQHAVCTGRNLCVVILDVDHLGRVNQNFGVDAGDRAMTAIGGALRVMGRQGDLVARIGGDSFGWILPGASGTSASGAAERARALVAALSLSDIGPLSLSAGVGELGTGGGTVVELIRRAETALRAAKDRGRNRTIRHVPTPTPGAMDPTVPTPATTDTTHAPHGTSPVVRYAHHDELVLTAGGDRD